MAAKEKGEASVGLLYLRVPHRAIIYADMRESMLHQRQVRERISPRGRKQSAD